MDPLAHDPGDYVADYWVLRELGKLRRALTQKHHALTAGKLQSADTGHDLARTYRMVQQIENSVRFGHGISLVGSEPTWVVDEYTGYHAEVRRDEV